MKHKKVCDQLKLGIPAACRPKSMPTSSSAVAVPVIATVLANPVLMFDVDDPEPVPSSSLSTPSTTIYSSQASCSSTLLSSTPVSMRQPFNNSRKRIRQSVIEPDSLVPFVTQTFAQCMADFLALNSLPSSLCDAPSFHRLLHSFRQSNVVPLKRQHALERKEQARQPTANVDEDEEEIKEDSNHHQAYITNLFTSRLCDESLVAAEEVVSESDHDLEEKEAKEDHEALAELEKEFGIGRGRDARIVLKHLWKTMFESITLVTLSGSDGILMR
jgi:hypothetical protein